VDQGYDLEIRTEASGEVGYCLFPDGSDREDGLRLAELAGGDASNAITREASALVTVPESNTSAFLDRVNGFESVVRDELAAVADTLSHLPDVYSTPAPSNQGRQRRS
jgi:putative hemolysin